MKRYRLILLLVLALALIPAVRYLLSDAPAPGIFSLRRGPYLILSLTTLVLVAVLYFFSLVRGRVLFPQILRMLPVVAIPAAVSFLAAWLWGRYAPSTFGPLTRMIAVVLMALCCLFIYFRGRRRATRSAAVVSIRRSAHAGAALKYDYRLLFCAMSVSLLVALIAVVAGTPSHLWIFPLASVSLSILLWRVLRWRFLLLLGFLAVEACALRYVLPVALSTDPGHFAASLLALVLYLSILLPLGDLYTKEGTIA